MLNTLKYYVGDAYDSSTEKIIGIMIIASNKEEAQQRYKECIERYLELIAIDTPGIAECINSEDLVDMIFCKKPHRIKRLSQCPRLVISSNVLQRRIFGIKEF